MSRDEALQFNQGRSTSQGQTDTVRKRATNCGDENVRSHFGRAGIRYRPNQRRLTAAQSIDGSRSVRTVCTERAAGFYIRRRDRSLVDTALKRHRNGPSDSDCDWRMEEGECALNRSSGAKQSIRVGSPIRADGQSVEAVRAICFSVRPHRQSAIEVRRRRRRRCRSTELNAKQTRVQRRKWFVPRCLYRLQSLPLG